MVSKPLLYHIKYLAGKGILPDSAVLLTYISVAEKAALDHGITNLLYSSLDDMIRSLQSVGSLYEAVLLPLNTIERHLRYERVDFDKLGRDCRICRVTWTLDEICDICIDKHACPFCKEDLLSRHLYNDCRKYD